MSRTDRPALVILDCDGVLVDSEPITNRLIAESLSEHGLPMTAEQSVELFVGGTIRGVYGEARRRGAALPETWPDMMYATMFAALGREVEAIPGAVDVLGILATQNVSHCVASNGPPEKMEITLGRIGVHKQLDGRIYSAHTVGIAKPDPGLFLHAARAMGVAPEATVVIEDSATGAKAAKAAGMRCFGFTRDTPEHKLTAHGAEPFADMADLPGLLGLT